MHSVSLAIVGGGPRALTILERLLEHSRRVPRGIVLEVMVIDPGTLGQGAHPSDQPQHLLINTLTSQVTMYPPKSLIGGDGDPSFLDWAAAQGYHRFADGYRFGKESGGAPLEEGDHLPRTVLGHFLARFGSDVIAALPDQIRVRHVRERAVDIERDRCGYTVHLDGADTIRASYLVLAMGHGNRLSTTLDRRLASFVEAGKGKNAKLAYVASPYPIRLLDGISSGARVAIQGLGLTAHDVVSALTIGRGGAYRRNNGRLTYRPSGAEPRLWLCSRHTLPFAARGINQKGRTGRHRCRFFTREAVASLRIAKGNGAQLDFERDILPLILKEMAFAYRAAKSGGRVNAGDFAPTSDEVRAMREVLWPLEGKVFDSPAAYRRWFLDLMRDDLREAFAGNRASGIKAATDVLRDAREGFREAVEFRGLTPTAHRYFFEEFNAITNRVSFGPPLRRNEEWLALFEAGILDVAGGPTTRIETPPDGVAFCVASEYGSVFEKLPVDVVVSARLDYYSPYTDSSPLSANLLRRGLIRPFLNGDYHPCGIDIDEKLHVKDANGIAQRHLWAIGFPVEGAHFYTHALPRPGIASRQTIDADHIVAALLDELTHIAQPETTAPTHPQQMLA